MGWDRREGTELAPTGRGDCARCSRLRRESGDRVGIPRFPDLRSIRAPRHPGVSDGLSEAFAEAAEVALARHHQPPRTEFAVECRGRETARVLSWSAPTLTMQRAWNNQDDTTRDAAYGVTLAAVEAELGLVAVMRAETRTGADYYIGSMGEEDLESALRLEVSGVDAGDPPTLTRRLQRKVSQARSGASNLPAIAGVVGFRIARVLLQDVEEA